MTEPTQSGCCTLMDWSCVPKPRFDPKSTLLADGVPYVPGMPVWDDEGNRLPDDVFLHWQGDPWGWLCGMVGEDIGNFSSCGPYFSSEANRLKRHITEVEQERLRQQQQVRKIEDRLSALRGKLAVEISRP